MVAAVLMPAVLIIAGAAAQARQRELFPPLLSPDNKGAGGTGTLLPATGGLNLGHIQLQAGKYFLLQQVGSLAVNNALCWTFSAKKWP